MSFLFDDFCAISISLTILTVTFLLITESSLRMYKEVNNPRIVQFPLHTVYTLLELDATDKHNVLLIADAASTWLIQSWTRGHSTKKYTLMEMALESP